MDFEFINDYEPSTSSSKIISPDFPLKNIKFSLFNQTVDLYNSLNISFHSVRKLKKINPLKINNHYYFKMERDNPDSIMYPLEAACAAFYDLIVPNHVPATHAVYDEKTGLYVGVSSKEIPGFQAIKDRPLTEEDLYINPEVLKYLSYSDWESLDKYFNKDKICDIKPDEVITHKEITYTCKVPNNMLWSFINSSNTQTVKKTKKIEVKFKDLMAYRVRKGNAIGITLSKVAEEEDFHVGNGSYDGKRIDFDMSWWKVLRKFKRSNMIDWALRSTSLHDISQEDIVNCPVYNTPQPLYGPTQPPPIGEILRSGLSSFFPLSQNAFPEHLCKLYTKFSNDPIFIINKYKTLLKCILVDRDILYNINKLHIKENTLHDGKPVIDILTDEQYSRITYIRQLLVITPEFKKFIAEHGDIAFKIIKDEFNTRNKKYQNKLKYKQLIIDLNKISNQFDEIKLEINNNHKENIIAIDDEELNDVISEEEFVTINSAQL